MNGLAFDSMGFFFAFGDMRGSAGIPGSTPENQVRISSNPIFREDFFLGRFNGDGALEWIQTFGSRNADLAAALDVDDQNNVWVTGTIQGDLVFHENPDAPVLYSGNRQESFLAQFSGGGILDKSLENRRSGRAVFFGWDWGLVLAPEESPVGFQGIG
ncbi:MAG: hypothetical protein LR011_14705 [Verrucomicrobia bacterium]|nr:hypothetical protein [Verrucomicrobiota bacterium]